jgi:hypothetical protein
MYAFTNVPSARRSTLRKVGTLCIAAQGEPLIEERRLAKLLERT